MDNNDLAFLLIIIAIVCISLRLCRCIFSIPNAPKDSEIQENPNESGESSFVSHHCGRDKKKSYKAIRFAAGGVLKIFSTRTPLRRASSRAYNSLSTVQDRPIGFNPEIISGTLENEAQSESITSCTVEDLSTGHDTTLELSSVSCYDTNPPPYEEVMKN